MGAPDPRYKYKDIRPPSLPLEKLDSWMDALMDKEAAKMGWLALIYLGLKMVLVIAYLIARKFLIDAQLEYEKQKYEQDRPQDSQDDLNNEVLEGDRRPANG